MATSEKSFRDRQGKATSLKDACSSFSVAFAPADASLTVANFSTFIETVTEKNDEVAALVAGYTTAAQSRQALQTELRGSLTQALGYLESNKAWKAQAATARGIVEKFRGTRPPAAKAATPAAGETPEVTKKRNQGNQAYVELASHLEQFIGVCAAVTGYAPPAATITVAALTTTLDEFKSLNSALSTAEQQLSVAQKSRYELYFEGEDCLQKKFQGIKKAVKGQYGMKSVEYSTVQAIKW
jgi:hypothetical protein